MARKLAPLAWAEDYALIDIRIDDDPIDFVQDKIDTRICFGHDLYGDYQVDELFGDKLIAVASPDFLSRFGPSVQDIPDRYLIHTDWGRGFASSPSWEAVLHGQRNIERNKGMSVQSSSTALTFVRHSFGIALVPAEMTADHISTGSIVQLDVSPLDLSRSYSIAYPKRIKSQLLVLRIIESLYRHSE